MTSATQAEIETPPEWIEAVFSTIERSAANEESYVADSGCAVGDCSVPDRVHPPVAKL